MISIKSSREIELMRQAGKYNSLVMKEIAKNIKVGVTTKYLDDVCMKKIKEYGCEPSCLGYEGYPASVCISINDEVVHGIPGKRKIKNGDIVSVDLVVSYHGYHADATRTFIVGSVSKEVEDLVKNTEQAFYEGCKVLKDGTRIKELGAAIEKYAHDHNLGVVEDLAGHGIGSEMHEDPEVPNYDDGSNIRLKAGMVIAIEPMLNLGTKDVYIEDDGWTIKTVDGKSSSHYENTVLITKDGYEILTGD